MTMAIECDQTSASASMTRLDRIACAALVAAVMLLCALGSPVMRWGLAGSVVLLLQAWSKPESRGELIALAVLVPTVLFLSAPVNMLIVHLTPHPLDAVFDAADFGLSTMIFRWTLAHDAAWRITSVVYESELLAVAFALATTDNRRRLAKTLVIGLGLGLLCFIVLPARGPAFAHDPQAFRNCMPSLHFTGMYIAWRLGPKRLLLRMFTGAFAAATGAAIIMSGQHYLLDLVAAFPFAYAVMAVSD